MTSAPTHVILVPGYWLGAWAWDDVVPSLRDAGLDPQAVTLPGLESADAARASITLDDHVAAVRDLVDTFGGDVVLVGHSGGAPVVQMVADQRPEGVRRVVYVDQGPARDGVSFFADLPADQVDVGFPSDEYLAANNLSVDGLDAAALARVRERAVRQPAGVMRQPVRVRDARRLTVPVTVICASLPSAVLRQLMAGGQIPTELPDYDDVEYVDLPTGHWPMFSRPADLAGLIAAAARR
jgi:pimeloyl-ACP methyl ester carboxylesterase